MGFRILMTVSLALMTSGCPDQQTTCRSHDDCNPCESCENGNCVLDSSKLNPCGDCGETPAEVCGDLMDNDCDGQTDEADCHDPCTGITCDQPPDDECTDAINCRHYLAPGSCDQGDCSYTFKDYICPSGCDDTLENPCADSGCVSCPEEYRPCGPGCCRWHSVAVDQDGDVGRSPSVVVDSSGVVHITYDYGNREEVRYARLEEGNWSTEIIQQGQPQWMQIDLDPDGRPRILFYDRDPNELVVSTLVDQVWQSAAIPAPDSFTAGYTAAVDQAGVVHIAYTDDPEGLVYAVYSGGSWELTEADPSAGDESGEWQASIRLDEPGQRIMIAYFHAVEQNLKLATLLAGQWSSETVDPETRAGNEPLLDLDVQGEPHVLYGAWHARKYAWRESGEWHTETVFSAEIGNSRFCLDELGRTHLAMPWSDRMDYGLKTDDWEFMTAERNLSLGVTDCAIDVDGVGIPHIVYYDAFTEDLRYSTLEVAEPERP